MSPLLDWIDPYPPHPSEHPPDQYVLRMGVSCSCYSFNRVDRYQAYDPTIEEDIH
jgi:hypothetical protein